MALKFSIEVDDQGNAAVSKLGRGIKDVEKNAADASKTLDGMGGYLEKAMAIGAFTKFIEAADEQERANGRLKAAMIGIGDSYERVSTQANDLTAALMRKTQYGDEDQIGALSQLIPLVGSYEEATRVLPNIMDLASFSQTDLSAATEQYAQLLNGDAPRGLSKFIPQLKDMAKNGASAADMMAVVQQKTAGFANMDVSSLTRTKNEVGEIAEQVGNKLVPSLDSLISTWDALPQPMKDIGLVGGLVLGASKVLSPQVTAAIFAIQTVGGAIKSVIDELERGKGITDALMAKTGGRGDLTVNQVASDDMPIGMTRTAGGKIVPKPLNIPGNAGGGGGSRKGGAARVLSNADLFGGGARNIDLSNSMPMMSGLTGPGVSDEQMQMQKDFEDFEQQSRELRLASIQDAQEQELAIHKDAFEQKYSMMLGTVEYTEQLEREQTAITDKYTNARMEMRRAEALTAMGTIGDLLGSFGALNRAMKGDAKASQILFAGQVAMNTAMSISKDMLIPPPWGEMKMIADIALGAAQLATIKSQKFATGGWTSGGGNSTSDSIPAMLSRDERVISANEVSQAGGRAAIDRAIDWAKGRMSGGSVQVVLNGPVDKGYVRDILLPAIAAEGGRI
jgi:hypothetical protein